MKILLTTHQFFPEYTSGTEVLALSVARELVRREHEVRVYTGHPTTKTIFDDERFNQYSYEGIHVYRFEHAYIPMGGQESMVEISYDNNLAAQYFQGILQDFRPDVVHFFHLNRLGTGLIDRAVAAGIPSFLTPTDFWSVCHTGQLSLCDGQLCDGPTVNAGNCVKHLAQCHPSHVIRFLAHWVPSSLVDRIVEWTEKGCLPPYPYRHEVTALGRRLKINISRINRLRKVLSPNTFMTSVLLRHGVIPDLVIQSTYGIDMTKSESNRKPDTSHHPLRIAFIGTLAQHKGCHILIDAFKILSSGKELLKIYGRTSDFPEYSSQLARAAQGRDDIEFCGVFPNGEIDRILTDIDVLVVPSLWIENTPLVVYSAHAAKCLVVASNFPGLAAAIEHEKNGLLFEPGDSKALANQLSRLIDEPELLQRLRSSLNSPKTTAAYVDELLGVWVREIATKSY